MTTKTESRNMSYKFSGFRQSISGNMTVIAAIALVPMIGTAGIAIDYVRANKTKTSVRAALDAAVLAGASAEADHAEIAAAYFASNFSGGDVSIISTDFKKTGEVRIDGSVVATVPTSFASILGVKTIKLELAAAAAAEREKLNSVCILALSPNESQSMLVNSGADVDASKCEIHVSSTANPAAIFNSGSVIDAKKTCIASTGIIDNGGVHPNMETGCETIDDPYAGTIPPPASTVCDFNNNTYSGNVTINPGVYCGWHNFNSGTNVTLNPGTYVIKSGGWNANGGTWTGIGVTFYYSDTSKIQFNSAVTATLTAPSSGVYKDILMAETEGLGGTQFIFDDSKGFDMTGIVHLPSREVVFNSGSVTRSHEMMAIVRKVIFNSTRWELKPFGGGDSSKTVTHARLMQ